MTGPVESETRYQFDQTQVDAIATAVDASAHVEGQTHYGLPQGASAMLDMPQGVDSIQRALGGIFFRGLRMDAENPARVRIGLYGDSVDEGGVPTYPPSIHNASEAELELWRALAVAATHPLPKSLLHDLLFTRRDGDVGLHAREAIRFYLEAAAIGSLSLSTRACSALRALTLLKVTKSPSQEKAASQALRDLIALELADESMSSPGLTLPMVAALVEITPIDAGTMSITCLLETVLERYGSADHIDYLAEVFRLSLAVSDARKEQVRRARVTTRLTRARNAEMAELKLFWLEDAASTASKLGYSDLYAEAVGDLQQVDTAAMNWVEIASDVEYPAELVAGYIGEFTNHGDWKRGLRQWLASGVPSGSYSDNQAVARNSLRYSVIQNLLPRFRVGTHGMPERRGTTDRLLEDKVRDVEYSHALIEGTLLFQALKEIGQLAKNPSEQVLSTLLMERYRCPAANATILAKALILFWRDEYLVCAYFVTPFIEAGVRGLLLELNEPISRGSGKNQRPVCSARRSAAALRSRGVRPRLGPISRDNDRKRRPKFPQRHRAWVPTTNGSRGGHTTAASCGTIPDDAA
jgi:hypothetical protein